MIFISYRRGDGAIFAGRLYDRLVRAYGTKEIFLDTQSLGAASDFGKEILAAVEKSEVVLAVISKNWVDDLNKDRPAGKPDYLRLELERAIEKKRIIRPIYIETNRDLPSLSVNELPKSLAPLANYNNIRVTSGPDFDGQVARLIKETDRIVHPTKVGFVRRSFLRTMREHAALAGIIGTLLVTAVLLRAPSPIKNWSESSYLKWKDPVLFSGSPSGKYRIARMFPGAGEVREESQFNDDIIGSRNEFSILVNTFGFYRNHTKLFEDMAARGVKLRFIVSAFHEEDREQWATFTRLAGEAIKTEEDNELDLVETIAQARTIREMLLELQAQFPDHVEVKLNRWPVFYSMWVRDPGEPTGIGHIGVHYYSEKSRWPSFRVSQTAGGELLTRMAEQFEVAWEGAVIP